MKMILVAYNVSIEAELIEELPNSPKLEQV